MSRFSHCESKNSAEISIKNLFFIFIGSSIMDSMHVAIQDMRGWLHTCMEDHDNHFRLLINNANKRQDVVSEILCGQKIIISRTGLTDEPVDILKKIYEHYLVHNEHNLESILVEIQDEMKSIPEDSEDIKHLVKSISKKLSKLKKHEELYKKNGHQITELYKSYTEIKKIELNEMNTTIKQARKRKAEPEDKPVEPVEPVEEPAAEPVNVQPSPERRTSKRKKSQHVKESEPSTSSESL